MKASIKSNQKGRRRFIEQLSTGLAGSMAVPFFIDKHDSKDLLDFTRINAPEDPLDERYWEMVKRQFAIPSDMMMVNSANLCPTPQVVNRRIDHFVRQMQENVSFQNRSQFAEIRKEALTKLASYLGASEAEVGITRNTTEGNNIIINGLELAKGDEVIVWDQNHPSNREAWENKARRSGFIVKRVATPANPGTAEDLIKPFADAVTNKTRIISFSHISNVTGIAMPAKQLCDFARGKNIFTLIDGAQAFGFEDLDLHDIGCDFYTASAHKWLMGPLENGILYIREENIEKVWPDSITVGWTQEKKTVDGKFCSLGQRNETTPPAMVEAINFHNEIGKENVEVRVRRLNTYLKESLRSKIPKVEFITPLSEEMSGGVTIFKIPDKDPVKVFNDLYEKYGIACAPTGGVRISTTICATMKDMDRIVDALMELTQ
jgi:selenocysteine lyase/cysteine desulfurase